MIRALVDLLPANEAERLQSLHHHELLHSLQEEVFDELVLLSAHLFGLPVSFIGLMDAHNLHFKASYGFWSPPAQPRQEMLCAQVIKRNEMVFYHDLAAVKPAAPDAPAIKNALTHQTRFYAGAPLRTASQHAIGTLCLAGSQPRAFNAHEQQVLECLASIVSQLLLLRYQCGQDEHRWQAIREKVRDELHGLRALVRYLLTRQGSEEPVPEEILTLVGQRLQDLRGILCQYAEPADK